MKKLAKKISVISVAAVLILTQFTGVFAAETPAPVLSSGTANRETAVSSQGNDGSYYSMAGDCQVTDKYTRETSSGTSYYIVIDGYTADYYQVINPKTSIKPKDRKGTLYTLSCTEEQYSQVKTGDVIICERDQTDTDYTGKVHSIGQLTESDIQTIIEHQEKYYGGFADVSQDTPHSDAIAYCADPERAIISGDGSGYFHPDKATTRATFAIILLRTLDISTDDVSEKNVFDDVKASDYFAPYLLKAYSMKLIYGCGDRKMMPETGMRTEDAAVILYRYFASENTSAYSGRYSIPDGITTDGTISDYAEDACGWVLSTGIIDPDGGTFKPDNVLTRAESAQIMKNISDSGQMEAQKLFNVRAENIKAVYVSSTAADVLMQKVPENSFSKAAAEINDFSYTGRRFSPLANGWDYRITVEYNDAENSRLDLVISEHKIDCGYFSYTGDTSGLMNFILTYTGK